MNDREIEMLEFEVASSFKELADLTSTAYALSVANDFIKDEWLEVNVCRKLKGVKVGNLSEGASAL